ncbi:MAG: glycosyltransferase [Pirellulaceae bacterium]|nr:glycosyltransferase [Pirellulaceae bacterium]
MSIDSIKHLLVITTNFPSPVTPSHGTFVKEFAQAVIRLGTSCTVVAPIPLHKALGRSDLCKDEYIDYANGQLRVLRPTYLSVGTHGRFSFMGRFNPGRSTFLLFEHAVRSAIKKHSIQPDAIYGHFLYFAGAAAVRVGSRLNVPAFPCVGEGELWSIRWYGKRTAQRDLAGAAGFLTVNSDLAKTLREDLHFRSQPIGIFPNGADLKKFFPRDRQQSRIELGLPQDKFLVASVGNFLEQKGVNRVGQAIDGLPGVAGVFAGSGPVPPVCQNVALCGRVSHEDMPKLLSACDVFVLPTLIEGSCNAIIEAMACGLPIISSDSAFNDDFLDDSLSVRVHPLDIAAIREAVVRLRDNSQWRKQLAVNSLKKAQHFDVNQRARNMLAFMSNPSQWKTPAQASC